MVRQEAKLNPDYLSTDKFNKAFKDWLGRIDERKSIRQRIRSDSSELRISDLIDLIRNLTALQFWGLIVADVGAIAAIFSLGYKLGTYLAKP